MSTNETKNTKKITVAEMLLTASEKVAKSNKWKQQLSASGNEFGGLNNGILALEYAEKDYKTNVWFSEKQAEEAGLQLKEDAGYGVQLFTKKLKDGVATVRYYTVYNQDQLQAIPAK